MVRDLLIIRKEEDAAKAAATATTATATVLAANQQLPNVSMQSEQRDLNSHKATTFLQTKTQ